MTRALADKPAVAEAGVALVEAALRARAPPLPATPATPLLDELAAAPAMTADALLEALVRAGFAPAAKPSTAEKAVGAVLGVAGAAGGVSGAVLALLCSGGSCGLGGAGGAGSSSSGAADKGARGARCALRVLTAGLGSNSGSGSSGGRALFKWEHLIAALSAAFPEPRGAAERIAAGEREKGGGVGVAAGFYAALQEAVARGGGSKKSAAYAAALLALSPVPLAVGGSSGGAAAGAPAGAATGSATATSAASATSAATPAPPAAPSAPPCEEAQAEAAARALETRTRALAAPGRPRAPLPDVSQSLEALRLPSAFPPPGTAGGSSGTTAVKWSDKLALLKRVQGVLVGGGTQCAASAAAAGEVWGALRAALRDSNVNLVVGGVEGVEACVARLREGGAGVGGGSGSGSASALLLPPPPALHPAVTSELLARLRERSRALGGGAGAPRARCALRCAGAPSAQRTC